MVEIETATFWLDSPEVQRGELRTGEIDTEVFLFPAAAHAEKDGCFTNTQRLLQWHEKAVDPPGDARSEAWFVYHLGRRLKAMAARDPRPRNAGLNALTWNYRTEGPLDEPVVEEVLQEINGRRVADGDAARGLRVTRGTTARTSCGCWIYSGVYPAPGRNRAREREPKGPYGHGWGFAWPADRRILYNRASARPDGTPWSERKKLVWWDESAGEWTGLDVPDFTRGKPPDYRPPDGASGRRGDRGRRAVHPAPRRRRLDLGRERAEGRAAAGALRAARVAGREPRLSAAGEPGGRCEGAPTTPTPDRRAIRTIRTCSPRTA